MKVSCIRLWKYIIELRHYLFLALIKKLLAILVEANVRLLCQDVNSNLELSLENSESIFPL